MTAVIDITGLKFGNLSVVSKAGSDKRGMLWLCECSCDNRKLTVASIDLRRGRKKSCGCTWRSNFRNDAHLRQVQDRKAQG